MSRSREPIAWTELLQVLANLAAPAGVLAGLLYYFSWVRTKATYEYFGIDQALLGLGTTDYLLRGAGIGYLPLAVLLLVAGAGLLVDLGLRRALATWPRLPARAARLAVGVLAGAALVCGVIGLTGRLTLSDSQLFNPLALAAGSAGLLYAASSRLAAPTDEAQPPPGLPLASRLVASGLVLVATFWGIALFADEEGRAVAAGIDADVAQRPAAVIYSRFSLDVSEPGVQRVELPAEDSDVYRFRYTGYRLLTYSGGRYFLLAEGWSREDASATLVLPDDPDRVRVDFQPAR